MVYLQKNKKKGQSEKLFFHFSLLFKSQNITPGISCCNMNLLSFFFSVFPPSAPSPAKLCQKQLLLVWCDPQMQAKTHHHLNVSLCMSEKLESGWWHHRVIYDLLVCRSLINQTNTHYSHLNDTEGIVKTCLSGNIHLRSTVIGLMLKPQENVPFALQISCLALLSLPCWLNNSICAHEAKKVKAKRSKENVILFIFSQWFWNVLPSPLHAEASHCPGGNVIQLAQYT